jgi:hypothetical protein
MVRRRRRPRLPPPLLPLSQPLPRHPRHPLLVLAALRWRTMTSPRPSPCPCPLALLAVAVPALRLVLVLVQAVRTLTTASWGLVCLLASVACTSSSLS